jgi:peptide/nickel transport system permease protein
VPYLLRKLALLLLTLGAALTINFFLPRLVPGNPIGAMIAKYQGRLDPSAAKALMIAYGLEGHDKNLLVQFGDYLVKLSRGDLGRSISFFPAPVTEMIGQAAPWTIGLVGVSTVISFLIGTGLGVYTAARRGSRLADLLVPVSLFLNSVPYFWFALIALYLFAFLLGWFPLGGGLDIVTGPAWSLSWIGSLLSHAVLPGATIVITAMGGWLIAMRNNLVSTLGEDYVAFARAKGLSDSQVLYGYGVRNAILPSLTAFGMALGFVLGGSILTEVVFGYPGLGTLLYHSVTSLDYPLMQAIFLFISLAVLAANFLVDITYTLLDPRVRDGGN